MMPFMNGYEICKEIRKKYTLYEKPVLFLSAKNQMNDLIKGFESGANDYLYKPFEYKEMLARIKTLLSLKKLTETNKILKETNELRNQLIHLIVHDLKNPISSIISMSKLLEYSQLIENDEKEFINVITKSSENMLSLISKILDAEKYNSGKIIPDKSEIEVNEICIESLEAIRQAAANKNQKILFHSCEGDKDCLMTGDYQMLRQLFDNLLSNAVKFSPRGKTITIEVSQKILSENNSFIQIIIQDEGLGFSKEDMQKMYGRFQKLSSAPTENENSTGLGLFIVKNIIEAHSGTISLDSEKNKGSAFTIRFPIHAG